MAIRSFDDLPEIFDVKTLMEVMDSSRASTYALVNRPDFPKFYVGNRIKIYKKAFLEWLDEQARPQAS